MASYHSDSSQLLPTNGYGGQHHVQHGMHTIPIQYQCKVYTEMKRRTVAFPKNVLSNSVDKIREFSDPQQLYYYLTWTCKMQIIDGEFMEYIFHHRQSREISIFNAELHEKNSNMALYIVSVPNEGNDRNDRNGPKWTMSEFMTAPQIYTRYHIRGDDLSIGSRYKHNYFHSEIQLNHKKLHSNIYVYNWNKVPLIKSQQYKDAKPQLNDMELNKAIKTSIDEIRCNNGSLSLIPILMVDTRKQMVHCDTLIPIKLQQRNKWMAISYKTLTAPPYKTVVTGLYIDPGDIINKATLVHADAARKYQWLKPLQINRRQIQHHMVPPPLGTMGSNQGFTTNTSFAATSIASPAVNIGLTPLTVNTMLGRDAFSNVIQEQKTKMIMDGSSNGDQQYNNIKKQALYKIDENGHCEKNDDEKKEEKKKDMFLEKKRIKRNIDISRSLIESIIPERVKEGIYDLYEYMDRTTVINYDGEYNDGKIRIFNYDFHDKQTGERLYCIGEKMDDDDNGDYKWKMKDILWRKSEIEKIYGIKHDLLPKSIRDSKHYVDEISNVQKMREEIKISELQQIIKIEANWMKQPVFGGDGDNDKNNKNNKEEMISLTITPSKFVENLMIKENVSNNHDMMIPILILNNNEKNDKNTSYHIEYIKIVRIVNDIDIGISFKYVENTENEKILKVTGIHCNKWKILNHHQLAFPNHECHCFDHFQSNIDRIYICNHQQDRNELKREIQKLKEEISLFTINSTTKPDVNRLSSLPSLSRLQSTELPSFPSLSTNLSNESIQTDMNRMNNDDVKIKYIRDEYEQKIEAIKQEYDNNVLSMLTEYQQFVEQQKVRIRSLEKDNNIFKQSLQALEHENQTLRVSIDQKNNSLNLNVVTELNDIIETCWDKTGNIINNNHHQNIHHNINRNINNRMNKPQIPHNMNLNNT